MIERTITIIDGLLTLLVGTGKRVTIGGPLPFEMAPSAMLLDQELAQYEKTKAELLKNHEGKFALIRGDEFVGAFDTPDNAYAEGIKRYGRESFLVKKITENEEVYHNQALSLGLMHARI